MYTAVPKPCRLGARPCLSHRNLQLAVAHLSSLQISAQAAATEAPPVELPKSGSGFQAEYDDEEIEVARAYEKEVPGSPHKFRRVLDIIRGLSYVDALSVLTYSPYRAAESLIDMLIDAAAVAKDDLGMRKTRLYVYQCYCDEGPTMKKFWPVAQGRLVKIRKRTSHLTVKLAEYDDETYQARKSEIAEKRERRNRGKKGSEKRRQERAEARKASIESRRAEVKKAMEKQAAEEEAA